MGAQLKLIIALQKIDSEIIRINNRKKILPEELASLDEKFQAFSADFEKDQKTLEELTKAHKEKDEKLKRGVENLKKTKDRLHEVKTNKEYQAMLKEIESTASKNSAIEDEILTVMDKLDQLRKMVKVRQKELEGHRSDYESEKRKIEQELAVMDA